MAQDRIAIVARFGKPIATITEPGLYTKAPLIDAVVSYDKHLLAAATAARRDHPRRPEARRSDDDLALPHRRRAEVLPDGGDRGSGAHQPFADRLQRSAQDAGQGDAAFAADRRARPASAIPFATPWPSRRRNLASTSSMCASCARNCRSRPARPYTTACRQSASARPRNSGRRDSKSRQQIRSKADREKEILLSDAQRESQTVRGVADAEANNIAIAAFGHDPEFYDLYRTLQVYRASLTQGGPTLVLSPSSELMKYFAQSPKPTKPAAKPCRPACRLVRLVAYGFLLRAARARRRPRTPASATTPAYRAAHATRRWSIKQRNQPDHRAQARTRRRLPGGERRHRQGVGPRGAPVGFGFGPPCPTTAVMCAPTRPWTPRRQNGRRRRA